MPSDEFINSKARGTEAEDFVIGIFEERGYAVVHRAADYFPDYDFAILDRQGQIKTVEVKYDAKAHSTGRFYLDLEALDHSKADILVICYGQPINALYFLQLADAREIAHAWPVKINAGEWNEEAALIPKRIFIEKFHPQIVEL